jgi:hypothetical protein
VIRKTDDLKSKIDTSQKVQAPANTKITTSGDSSVKRINVGADINTGIAKSDSVSASQAVIENKVPAKSNTKIWKEYTDALVEGLKAEVLTSKKVKKETYFIMVDYEIGTDGLVSILNVTANPENEFLQNHVKDRMLNTPLQLSPVLDSAKQPRKVKRKQNFTITKE